MLKIQPTDDLLPSSFGDAVRMLKRPYISITAKQNEEIEKATEGHGDIFLYKGKRMTWGQADGGYAMMPLAV